MYVRVHVTEGAPRTRVKQVGKTHFELFIRPRIAHNNPNSRTTEIMAKHLEVPKHAVKIWGGKNAEHKLLVVNDEYLTKINKNPNATLTADKKPKSGQNFLNRIVS